MRQIVYIILFIAALLVVKAMFLDDYLAKRAAESNTTKPKTTEVNGTEAKTRKDPFVKPEPRVKTSSLHEVKTDTERNMSSKKEKPKPSYSEMPLEKVGGKIAEKIENGL